LIVVVFAGLVWFFGWQYGHFARDLPQLRVHLNEKVETIQRHLDLRFHIGTEVQDAWTAKQLSSVTGKAGSIALGIFSATGAVLAVVLLIPIFTFLLLVLKAKFHTFLEQVSEGRTGTVLHVVKRSAELSRKYMRGVLTVMIILSVLNSIGFLLLGLKYAILLGVTAAVLNVVPYIGPWVGSILPMIIALITKDSLWYPLGAVAVILLSQFLDNNFITPKIVGSSVSINPLASLVALIGGGLLWGPMGLLLAIPITGMLKIICEVVPGLKPWAYLLGEEVNYPKEGMFMTVLSNSPGKRAIRPGPQDAPMDPKDIDLHR
jgi:predicted PurR-regulated permease PerM